MIGRRGAVWVGARGVGGLRGSGRSNIGAAVGVIAMIAALNQLKGRQVLNARTD
ncbi:hypothetical protein [Vibrio furnissii]|uniref:hypothetical protein n=1 Tax=Vibrio furnissii TaxID=29494 RepID=UPI001EEAB3D6|nr:hypothetical protein [Vibrio furnissii]MCG6232951.1 hypothetical protein [Vibrio furnissii]MCG6257801.1 hypothetical protein [Vibrio furnissii]